MIHQVVMSMYDGDGNELHSGVVASSGGGPQCPAVFYHNNNPVWEETFRLDIGLDMFQSEDTHLRLEYYHCSVKERQERKLIGFSWLELMRGDGTVIRLDIVKLPVFSLIYLNDIIAEMGSTRLECTNVTTVRDCPDPCT